MGKAQQRKQQSAERLIGETAWYWSHILTGEISPPADAITQCFVEAVQNICMNDSPQSSFPYLEYEDFNGLVLIGTGQYTISDLKQRKLIGCSWLDFFKAHSEVEKANTAFVIVPFLKKRKTGDVFISSEASMLCLDKKTQTPSMFKTESHPAMDVFKSAVSQLKSRGVW